MGFAPILLMGPVFFAIGIFLFSGLASAFGSAVQLPLRVSGSCATRLEKLNLLRLEKVRVLKLEGWEETLNALNQDREVFEKFEDEMLALNESLLRVESGTKISDLLISLGFDKGDFTLHPEGFLPRRAIRFRKGLRHKTYGIGLRDNLYLPNNTQAEYDYRTRTVNLSWVMSRTFADRSRTAEDVEKVLTPRFLHEWIHARQVLSSPWGLLHSAMLQLEAKNAHSVPSVFDYESQVWSSAALFLSELQAYAYTPAVNFKSDIQKVAARTWPAIQAELKSPEMSEVSLRRRLSEFYSILSRAQEYRDLLSAAFVVESDMVSNALRLLLLTRRK